jgi:hypothetical protein
MKSLFNLGGDIDPAVDVYIVSYPKAGRTWLRVMLGYYLCESYGFDEKGMLDTHTLTGGAKLSPTQFTHDHSSIMGGLSVSELSSDKRAYCDKRIIFLQRGLKDLLVSCFFQATKRVGQFRGGLQEFLRDERFGAMKAATFHANWYAAQTVPREFLAIRYEDLHLDPHRELQHALNAIGVDAPDMGKVDSAVHFGEFDNMQSLERADHFNTEILRPGSGEDGESFKVRSGRIGGYEDYLGAEDIIYVDEIIEEFNCPFVY